MPIPVYPAALVIAPKVIAWMSARSDDRGRRHHMDVRSAW
jgi:hypothetical protein